MRLLSFLGKRWAFPLILAACTPSGDPNGPLLFLGDSLTRNLPAETLAPDVEKYGVGGRTIKGLLRDLPAYRVGRARGVVLTIGTNDARWPYAGMEADLRQLSHRLPGPLYWNTIPPIRSREGNTAAMNAIIRRVCAERQDCVLVETPWDAGTDLLPDGVHLTPEGQSRWLGVLRETLGATPAALPETQ